MATPAYLQVEPTELVLKPGQTVKLHARLFDDEGRFLREDTRRTWSLDGLKGTVNDGSFTVGEPIRKQPGLIKATVGASDGRGARAGDSSAAVDGNVRFATPMAQCRRAGSTRPRENSK